MLGLFFDSMPVTAELINCPQKALKAVEHCIYDLIICDLEMPNMRGTKFVSSLRTNGNHTPIVLMTAHVDEIDLKKNDIDFILRKPFTLSQLMEIIEVVKIIK